MLEKGRLYSLRKDGTRDSVYLNVKNKRFLFGSSECCTVRMYIDGIFPQHCVLTVGDQEKVCLEPLHPSALTLVNGIKIKHKVFLEEGDVITIFLKKFLFTYSSNSLSGNISSERLLVLPYSKQLKSTQKFEMSTFIQSWETSCPFSEWNIPSVQDIPKKQICLVESGILKKTPNYVLKFLQEEPIVILYINAREINSCSGKSLIKYINQYLDKSFESRRNLALKLYQFISFVRGLLNKNTEYLCDLCPVLEFVWKYCIARASEDILFLPLKSLNLKGEINALKKSLPSRILLSTPENSLAICKTMPENENCSINSLEVNVSSAGKINEQKKNQYTNRKASISYKKRVSLAVKRYHFRKRKSVMMANTVESGNNENREFSDEREQMRNGCIENNSNKQDDVLNLENQKYIRTKRKRSYSKKEKEKLNDKAEFKTKQEIHAKVVKDAVEVLNSTSEPVKEKRRNKKATVKKTDLNVEAEKENISELIENYENQVTIPLLKEQKQWKGKQNRNRGPKESIDSSGELANSTKLTETKSKRSYKRKKKETVTDKTAFKDEVEIKLIHDSPLKQNNTSVSNELKLKKVNCKKKEKSLEATDLSMKNNSDKQKQDTQELSHCQRITRSMAKSRR